MLWERSIGRLNASSPAYSRHRLYIVNLVPGHIVKLDAKTGKIVWKHSLPGRAESSPVVIGRTVYFGCEDGNLYALSTISGNVRWATQPRRADQVGARLLRRHPLRRRLRRLHERGRRQDRQARSGRAGSLGQGFGTSGEFYSTPAVAFGRVYAGNNDDRVYSFDIKDGTLAWSYSTGGYAYSGPTVSNTRHSPPTVYIGSFDGNVYALDAKDGSVRWSRSAGGQVVGSLSAIGDIVYVAEFTNNTTSGFMMKSGRRVFHYGRGTYSPVISDGRHIYLTGYSSITALQPYKYKRGVAPAIVAPARKRPSHAQKRTPQANCIKFPSSWIGNLMQFGVQLRGRGRPGVGAVPRAGQGRRRGRPGGGGRR